MKSAIVTGAGGFIGGAVAKILLEKGIRVYGVDINKTAMSDLEKYEGFIPVVADFENYNNLHKYIHRGSVDVFFHFALQGSFGKSLKDYSLQLYNTKGACNANMAAIELHCKKFVLSGTANQFELAKYINMDYFEPRYTCIYSTGKMAAEFICKTLSYNNGIEYSAGLIAMAYGEGNKSIVSLPNIVINQILHKQKPQLIEGNNIYDMVYIDEIVGAFIAIAENGKNMKSYYVGYRSPKTFKKIMCELRDVLDKSVELDFGAYKDVPSGMDYSNIDVDALYNDTGFECKADFRESILKTAEWVKTLDF